MQWCTGFFDWASQKYYVCKGRQGVKRLTSKCVLCRKLEAKPFATPPAADQPQFRLSDDFVVWIFVGLCLSKIYFQRTLECTRLDCAIYMCIFSCDALRYNCSTFALTALYLLFSSILRTLWIFDVVYFR